MIEVSKQLKKGALEIVVLKLLCIKDMYGYELIQKLEGESEGVFKIKEGTLYPILYRLEDSKLIQNYWEGEKEKRGVPRKYYRITDEGKLRLSDMKEEWQYFISGVNSILELKER